MQYVILLLHTICFNFEYSLFTFVLGEMKNGKYFLEFIFYFLRVTILNIFPPSFILAKSVYLCVCLVINIA